MYFILKKIILIHVYLYIYIYKIFIIFFYSASQIGITCSTLETFAAPFWSCSSKVNPFVYGNFIFKSIFLKNKYCTLELMVDCSPSFHLPC
jgi:hypothetical protein